MLEVLRKRLKDVEASVEKAIANVNMLIGRRQELHQTITELEKPVSESVDEKKEDEHVDQSPAV